MSWNSCNCSPLICMLKWLYSRGIIAWHLKSITSRAKSGKISSNYLFWNRGLKLPNCHFQTTAAAVSELWRFPVESWGTVTTVIAAGTIKSHICTPYMCLGILRIHNYSVLSLLGNHWHSTSHIPWLQDLSIPAPAQLLVEHTALLPSRRWQTVQTYQESLSNQVPIHSWVLRVHTHTGGVPCPSHSCNNVKGTMTKSFGPPCRNFSRESVLHLIYYVIAMQSQFTSFLFGFPC